MHQLRRKNLPIVLFLLSVLLTATLSCSSDEIVTNPGSDLRFSSDTLSFDTLFSTVGSTTAWMTVHNTGDKTIRIASISLKSGGTSGFRINLDGETKISFTDVEIPAHDSLFLFVEVKTSNQGASMPVKVTDAILFDTEGPRKQIVLEAWSWDAVFWKGKMISSDTTFSATKPIVIYDSLVVAEHTTLTLLPGTKMYFHDGAFMRVEGTLNAVGTKEAPVLLRGDRLDNVLPDLPYDFYPGQWGYLHFDTASFNNQLDHVDIHGAYYGVIAISTSSDKLKLRMSNSVIHNMVYNCLWNFDSDIEIENTQLTNSGSYTVKLVGGSSIFTHCTIANFQRFLNREGQSLALVNFLNDAKDTSIIWPYPASAEFRNCIVSGSQSEEVGLGKRANIPWFAFFKNCLLRSSKIPNTQATLDSCSYASDAKFLKLGYESDKYVYDFRLDSISPARNIGSTKFLTTLPTDMNGISRTKDNKPDAGAFEWVHGQK